MVGGDEEVRGIERRGRGEEIVGGVRVFSRRRG